MILTHSGRPLLLGLDLAIGINLSTLGNDLLLLFQSSGGLGSSPSLVRSLSPLCSLLLGPSELKGDSSVAKAYLSVPW